MSMIFKNIWKIDLSLFEIDPSISRMHVGERANDGAEHTLLYVSSLMSKVQHPCNSKNDGSI